LGLGGAKLDPFYLFTDELITALKFWFIPEPVLQDALEDIFGVCLSAA
jgi:hypothetical protein